MGVDQTSLDRIRNATFPTSRRGYDKHEVEKFLARLADWLETGGGDASRSETVKRELERVGERTGAILSQAEESAQQIRSEAEQLARETVNEASAEAEKARTEADAYARQTREEADAYAELNRSETDREVTEIRAEAEQDADDTIADAQAQAARIVEEGIRRREDIEAVIADLVRRRDEVLEDVDELGSRLSDAIGEHRPDQGADPFDAPDELDPVAREVDAHLDEELEDDDLALEGELPSDGDDDEPVDEEPAAVEQPQEPAAGEEREEPAPVEEAEQPATEEASQAEPKRRGRRVSS